jgi:hypothetical protein
MPVAVAFDDGAVIWMEAALRKLGTASVSVRTSARYRLPGGLERLNMGPKTV